MSSKLSALATGAAIADADLFYSSQGGVSVKQPASALATYVSAKLNVTLAYAFTGLGSTNLLSASTFGWNSDTILQREAAGTIGQRNGASPQLYYLYNTYSGAGANFERGFIGYVSNQFQVGTAKAGTGAARAVVIGSNLSGTPDNFLALQGSNIRFFSGSLGVESWNLNTSTLQGASNAKFGFNSTASGNGTIDTIMTRGGAAATFQLGDANAAAPVAQTLQAQGSRPGTDTNVGGANLTIQPGTGTGTGAPATTVLKSPVPTTSGSVAQTQNTTLTMNSGVTQRPGIAFANLPGQLAGTTAVAGMEAYITDSTTTTWGAIIAGGGTSPVMGWYNGSNWTVIGK